MPKRNTPSHAVRVNRIRVAYWYCRLKLTYRVSDKELNRLLQPDLHPDEAKGSRTFERIRTDQTIPSRGKNRKDGRDIVEVMDHHVPGSGSWYEAPFWDAVARPADTLIEATAVVMALADRHGFVRAAPEDFIGLRADLPGHSDAQIYGRMLQGTLHGLASLDRLGLLVALYREADLGSVHAIMETLSARIDEELNWLCISVFGHEDAFQHYEDLLAAVLHAPRGDFDRGDAGHTIASRCSCPLVVESMVPGRHRGADPEEGIQPA
jgi:hypothetical protein